MTGFDLGRLHNDITLRDHETLEDIDLYMSGFPCQPLSALGKRLWTADARGHIGFHCLEVVIVKRPAISIFENVRGLLHKKHERFTALMKSVLKEWGYKVFMKVLDTKDYGVPQSRPRVYIVAIHKSAQQSKFKWPKPMDFDKKALGKLIQREKTGEEIVDIKNYEEAYEKDKVWKKPYILDVQSSSKFQSARCHCAPCLTFSRFKNSTCGYYIPALCRRLSIFEAGRLQGMPDSLMTGLLSKHQPQNIGAALGDGMSINVLRKVLLAALIAIGFLPEGDRLVRDQWMAGFEWEAWNM